MGRPWGKFHVRHQSKPSRQYAVPFTLSLSCVTHLRHFAERSYAESETNFGSTKKIWQFWSLGKLAKSCPKLAARCKK